MPPRISAGAGGEFDVPLLTQPFVLADGTPALSWITNVGENHFTLHLATEGGTRPASGPAPRVRFGAPVHRVLDYDDALRLPFTCSGPCSVRARIVGHQDSDGVATRFSAGSDELRIYSNDPIAAKSSGTVRVRVKYGAPDSVDLKTQMLTVRVQRSSKPKPRIIAFKAVRRGASIRVSFRPLRPAELRAALHLRQPEPRRPRQPVGRHDRDGRAPGQVLPRDAAPGRPGALRHPAHDRRTGPARADDGQSPLMRAFPGRPGVARCDARAGRAPVRPGRAAHAARRRRLRPHHRRSRELALGQLADGRGRSSTTIGSRSFVR